MEQKQLDDLEDSFFGEELNFNNKKSEPALSTREQT